MTDQVQALFTPVQVQDLVNSGIEPGFAFEYGVRCVREPGELPAGAPAWWAGQLPGLVFPYTGSDGRVEPQLKPDFPVPLHYGGKPPRYLFRSTADGYVTTPWVITAPQGNHPIVYVEGAKKALSVAGVRPAGWGVVAISSCTGGAQGGVGAPELGLARGRDTYVCMDGDYESNAQVWDAAQQLFAHLALEDPTRLRMVKLPKGGKAKIDDLLAARRTEEDRRRFFLSLTGSADAEAFPASRRPKGKKAEPGAEAEDPGLEMRLWGEGQLDVKAAAEELLARTPMALVDKRGEDVLPDIAVYRNGVYHASRAALIIELGRLLGGRYRANYVTSVEHMLIGLLGDRVIPDRTEEGDLRLNCRNGLLRLDTGVLEDHTPDFLSTVQLPIDFDPAATCPRWETWLAEQVGEDQIAVLEEGLAAMLDPHGDPEKALFLYGVKRGGKGTLMRIVKEIAGPENTSSISLHQFSDDDYASSWLRGKILNVSGEISAKELRDTSRFKELTGRDEITANPKFGRQFQFRNHALMLFSCNTENLPTIHDADDAYFSRITPIKFERSFEGSEDPKVEARLKEELPGILCRLILAHSARRKRRAPRPVSERVMRHFQDSSNTVREWVVRCCAIEREAIAGVTTTSLHQSYTAWAQMAGIKHPVGSRDFSKALGIMSDHGIAQSRTNKGRWWNVKILGADEWKDSVNE